MSGFDRSRWGGRPEQLSIERTPDIPLFLHRGVQRIRPLGRRRDLRGSLAAEMVARGELHAVLLAEHVVNHISLMDWMASLLQMQRPFSPPGASMQRRRRTWDLPPRSRMHDRAARRADEPSGWRDVGAADTYSIRDAAGNALAFRTISLVELRLAPDLEPERRAELPSGSIADGRAWLVTAFP